MSIIASFGRKPGYPKSKEALSGKKFVVTHSDMYDVLVTDESALGPTVFAALPSEFAVGTEFIDGTSLKERSLDRNAQNRKLWHLSLSYTSDVDDQEKQDANKPPDQRKAEWAWDFETVSYVIMKDVDDSTKAIANSAGEPYEATREIAIPVLTVERWETFFDPAVIIGYVNHRNKNTFWTAPADSAICTGIRDRKDTTEAYGGIYYRKVTYTFKFMVPFIVDVMEGAKLIVADIGTRYLLTAGATSYTTYRATDGMPTRAKLNTDGTLRTAAQTLLFKKFNVFPKADFNDLRINNTQI